ncbi:Aldo/keto reductase [Calocera viscosa TUFC12733]|uniref:Aldo/keto reductase n=1 Tax=Calocera viscosa (strain TUFC12733) TaxID=1330018 RepID=A0A167GE08_CALVF|nr:Aldo/keto reductase [Calocera viscosa TUFC12733]
MPAPSKFTLNTGATIPAGPGRRRPARSARPVVHALKAGYRHLDCALIYQNEEEVGDAIKQSGVPREEIFITSKAWNVFHHNVQESLEKTLKDLQVDYLDLFLVHWPVRLVANGSQPLLPVNPNGTRSVDYSWNQEDTWRQMEEIYKSGKVKAIGVSNWSIPYLERLEKSWKVVPAINQVELHPYLPQHKLKEWCESRGILLEAYCPLGSTGPCCLHMQHHVPRSDLFTLTYLTYPGAPLLEDTEIQAIAAKYAVPPATILISYQVNRGVIVLPKSVTASRIEQNLKVIDIKEEDMKTLEAIAENGKQKRVNMPKWGSDLGFDDWPLPSCRNETGGGTPQRSVTLRILGIYASSNK